MAHFAKLDENNNVLFVTPLEDSLCDDNEEKGKAYLEKVHNWPYWKKTSYNTRGGKHYDPNTNELSPDQSKAYRGNYAGTGFQYDSALDLFKVRVQPFPSWTLNTTTGLYDPPVPEPVDTVENKAYQWNESSGAWDKVENP